MNKRETKLTQHLFHENEEQDFDIFLKTTAPLIGYIVHSFNALEQSLNAIICEEISFRTDEPGLIIIHNMPYSSKVDLFDRFNANFFLTYQNNELKKECNELVKNLRESARLRNIVVHADWNNTDFEGYTYVKIKITKDGLKQEYFQFTEDSLEVIDDFIIDTDEALDTYWEKRIDLLQNK